MFMMNDTGLTSALKPKQRQIAFLVGQGMTNREIGEMLDLSAFTVRNEVSDIGRRLRARNRSQIAFMVGQSLAGSSRLVSRT